MQANTNQPNRPEISGPGRGRYSRIKDEKGIAMILSMIALSLLTAFSAYLFLTSVEDERISGNNESMVQARFAARAGIDHARELLRGLKFDNLLKGADGTVDTSSANLSAARQFAFRNLTSWNSLRRLNVLDPAYDVSALPDDGLFNTGKVGSVNGTILVPKTGIAFTTGGATTARYFLKVTDNNGEASEIARDAANNPFVDGDGIIIVRSMGVARTLEEGSGASARRNSVAIYEARFQQSAPFADLGSPAVVIGNNVRANFSGNAFNITGTSAGPGIGAIDTNPLDAFHPDQQLAAATSGKGTITGNCSGATANQCIGDITGSVQGNPDKSMLTDPEWLYDFVYNKIPLIADYSLPNNSFIDSSNAGTPANPKITFVDGSCTVTGDLWGAGLLVVTGDLKMGGAIRWDGLVLVIGKGEFWTHGMNNGIYGGLIVAGVSKDASGHAVFTDANTDFDIRGNSNIATYDGSMSEMGNGLIPLKQLSMREVTSNLDP